MEVIIAILFLYFLSEVRAKLVKSNNGRNGPVDNANFKHTYRREDDRWFPPPVHHGTRCEPAPVRRIDPANHPLHQVAEKPRVCADGEIVGTDVPDSRFLIDMLAAEGRRLLSVVALVLMAAVGVQAQTLRVETGFGGFTGPDFGELETGPNGGVSVSIEPGVGVFGRVGSYGAGSDDVRSWEAGGLFRVGGDGVTSSIRFGYARHGELEGWAAGVDLGWRAWQSPGGLSAIEVGPVASFHSVDGLTGWRLGAAVAFRVGR